VTEKELDIVIKAVNQNTAAVNDMIAKTEALQVSTTKHAAATKAAAAEEKSATEAGKDLARAFGGVGEETEGLLGKVTALGGALGTAGPVGMGIGAALVGFGALFEAGKQSVETFEKDAEAVRNFQRVAGTSAEDSSRLVDAFKLFGVNADEAGQAIYRMNNRLAGADEAGNKVTDQLGKLGVEIKRTQTGTIDEIATFDALGAAYARTADAAQKNAILYEAFGRSGQQVSAVLEETAGHLQDVADAQQLVFTQEDLDRAHAYEVASNELTQQVDVLKTSIGEKLVPVLTDFDRGATLITGTLDKMATATRGNMVTAAGLAYADLEQQDAAMRLKDKLDQVTKSYEDQRAAENKLYNTDLSAIDASIGHERALREVSDAVVRLKDDTDRYGATSQQARDDIDRLRDAMVNDARTAADLAAKHEEAAGSMLSASDKAKVFQDALQHEIDTLGPDSPLRKELQGYIDQLNNIPREVTTQFNAAGNPVFGPSLTGGRQHGGPVAPGGIYSVGESGPETLVMGAAGGYVFPGAGRGGSGGGSVNITVNVESAADPFRIGSEIAWALKYGDSTPPSGQSIFPVTG
jgi:hypothetical protein